MKRYHDRYQTSASVFKAFEIFIRLTQFRFIHVKTINNKTELKILKRRALIDFGQENEVKVL